MGHLLGPILGNNFQACAVSCKGALEKFSKTTNFTRYLLRAREIFGLLDFLSFLLLLLLLLFFFFLKLCQYYFVLLPTGCSLSF